MNARRTLTVVMLALALSVVAVSSVWAAKAPETSTLFTPPLAQLPAGWGEPQIKSCEIVNVSAAVRHVTVVLLDADGAPVLNAPTQDVDLGPGQATSLLIRSTSEQPVSLAGLHYCKFIVAGAKEDFRAHMFVYLGAWVSVPAH